MKATKKTIPQNRRFEVFFSGVCVDQMWIRDTVQLVQRSAGSCISRWQLFQCFSQNVVTLLLFCGARDAAVFLLSLCDILFIIHYRPYKHRLEPVIGWFASFVSCCCGPDAS